MRFLFLVLSSAPEKSAGANFRCPTLDNTINSARWLLFMLLLLATGCAHERVARVTGAYPDSPCVQRCLAWYVSNCSTNATNHFYVGAVHGGAFDAFVYWAEERTILDYTELDPDSKGAEAEAWRGGLKLDRDTVDTQNDIGGSTYLITHRLWVDWMEQCLSRGRECVITMEEARRLYPKKRSADKRKARRTRVGSAGAGPSR